MVSLHGGHSSAYCDHAADSLRDILDAAIAAGYHSFGVSEHAPRSEARFLYPNEHELGWTLEKTISDFDQYMIDLPAIAAEYADRLDVICGFEAEVVPASTYVEKMLDFRRRSRPNGKPLFDFFVGSVHFVNEIQIDGEVEDWVKAMEACGGPEALATAYYDEIATMVDALKPDVVGHLDLIKRNVLLAGIEGWTLQTAKARAAADRALEAIKANDGILDLNTAGWRKGLGEPYPAPWIIERAVKMDVSFCFGDDSHRISHVGEGVAAAREYLLQNGVISVTTVRQGGERVVYLL